MTPAQIKVKRTESVLLELIPEALSTLNDNRLHEVDVVEVKCSRGRSDAKVYIDPHDYTDQEKQVFLKQLKKSRPIVEDYCMKDQGWYSCPKLSFEFDTQFATSKKIEELFKKIEKERESK